jgi:Papain fold toxin 2
LSLATFFGCQKESFLILNKDNLQEKNESKIDPKYKAPTVEDAQNWFEQSFGKTHTIITKDGDTTKSSVLNVRGSSPQIDVTPIWSNAQISAYLSNRQVLMVPVNPISALQKRGIGYCAVFFRDSIGEIGYTLQVTATKPNYFALHDNLSVNDFSGAFFQIKSDGLVKNTLVIETGKIVGSFKLTNTNVNNFSPISFGWLEYLNYVLLQFEQENGNASGFPDREPPYTGVNYGDANDNPYGPSSGSSSGPIYYPPIVLNTEIDNTLFDIAGQETKRVYYQGLYVLDNQFLDTEFEIMYNNDKALFTLIHNFLTDNGFDENSKQLVKEIISLPNMPGPQDPKFLMALVTATGKSNNNVNFRCIEYQKALKVFLDANKSKYGISSIQYFEIKGATSFIKHSDYQNGNTNISEGGVHRITLIDGYIFDNHHPKGKLKAEWDKGLIIISPRTILPVVP